MKRKIFVLAATTILAIALAPHTTHAAEPPTIRHEMEIEKVIARVRIAFETHEGCRNLFPKYKNNALRTLDRARFIYVGDALQPLGFAAATIVGTNQTFIGAGF